MRESERGAKLKQQQEEKKKKTRLQDTCGHSWT